MPEEDTIESIKRSLNGRPGQPIVFGVCKALAARLGYEPWVTRGATIVLGLFFTLPVLATYILLGLFMKETEARTRGFFSGLSVIVREWTEKFCGNSRQSFDSGRYDRGYR